MKKVKWSVFMVSLLFMLCLSACGNKNEALNTEYDNPAEYFFVKS